MTCLLLHAETGEPMRFIEIYQNAAALPAEHSHPTGVVKGSFHNEAFRSRR